MIIDNFFEDIKRIESLSNNFLKNNRRNENEELERFFCKFEQIRSDLYSKLRTVNGFREFGAGDPINNIIYEYKAELKNNVLKIYIPERIPKINKGINYIQKEIMFNVSRVAEKYKGLFYDKSVLVIVKIYDNIRIWDSDNRNIKPIHDGLINGKVIKDDNIYCSSYMVQGYYSRTPYAEVYVLESDKIINKINKRIIRKVDKKDGKILRKNRKIFLPSLFLKEKA